MNVFLYRLIYGGASKLRDYELCCIECLKNKLPSAVHSILEVQVKDIDSIHRYSNDKIVLFRFLRKNLETTLPLFPNNSPEIYVARLTLRSVPNTTCNVVFHEGKILSLEFSHPPRSALKQPFICHKVEILEDLLHAPLVEHTSSSMSDDTGMLKRIRTYFDISNVLPPPEENKIEKFLVLVSTALPEDYVNLLHETNGFSVKDWCFYGINARSVVLPDTNYWVVAEDTKNALALCFREGETSSIVIIYDQINEDFQETGQYFVEAFIQAVAKSTTASDS
ncbi:MAG: hypothetical protein JOZ57_15250 [Abitibacteriaceae bacterium]|nr:hypothetical protein [Abditibacteriaceae bacterium]